jgi:hypothetical protein
MLITAQHAENGRENSIQFLHSTVENDLKSTDEFADSAFSATSPVNEEFQD